MIPGIGFDVEINESSLSLSTLLIVEFGVKTKNTQYTINNPTNTDKIVL
jgi:hypothetical protein